MLSEELKESTRAVHAALEKKLIGHIRLVEKPADYARLLSLLYGYYHSLEENLHQHLSIKNISDLDKRRKSSLLLRDLNHLSFTNAPPLCEDLPPILHPADAMGAMYVLEGSTLGGEIIANMIEKQMPAENAVSFSFFRCYGKESMTMWQSFKNQLERFSTDAEKQDVLKSAHLTFTKFYNWIDKNESTELRF
jgi:heme oxygenase (biliverdin-IX-beta and delta-forming)